MLQSSVVFTSLNNSSEAGTYLANRIRSELNDAQPDVLLVFASTKYDYRRLLEALQAGCNPKLIIGCSSAGELTHDAHGEGAVSVLALRSTEMKFSIGVGKGLRQDRALAATQMISSFRGQKQSEYPFKAAMILTDALAGAADELIEEVSLQTGGIYQLFGGGAGDDVKYSSTVVFAGTEIIPDAAVALEIVSKKPIGVGVHHGWRPVGANMRVTASEGGRIISLNASSPVEILKAHAHSTGQEFDLSNPGPFLLHNIIGIDTGTGYKLRVPMQIMDDGSIVCAAEVPVHSVVCLMQTTAESSSEASAEAVKVALSQLNSAKPEVAIFFDCVATRIRTGQEYDLEARALKNALGNVKYAGFNTYGQIARMDGQFSGFHNATAVVCVLPG
jgi:hypothetical protein